VALGNGDQRALFRSLQVLAVRVTRTWDCTIDGSGSTMRVRLAESASKRTAWSFTGSAADVLVAFTDWLWK
jgi:hypothetical protein